jgi:hypothetical protein
MLTALRGRRADVGPLLAAALGLGLVAACTTVPGIASPTPGSSGEPSAAATQAAGPRVATWSTIDIELDGGWLSDVEEIGGSVVAVGSTGSGPLALASTDGGTWTRASEQPSFETPGGAGMSSLITWQGGLVAIGPGDRQSVAWRSTDGLTWEKTYESHYPSDEEIAAGYAFEGAMYRGAQGPTGLVAVGLSVNGLTGDFGGAAWTSQDGASWTSVPPDVQLSRAPLYDVTVLGDGSYVAVGGYLGATSLLSPDGRSWTLHEQRDVLSDGQLRAITVGSGGRVIAVGDESAQGFSATSSDGALWQRGLCNGAMTDAVIHAVSPLGDGFVAGGAVGAQAAIWVSADGRSWERVRAQLGAGQVSAILSRPDAIIAVGTGVWVGPAGAVGDGERYPEAPCGAPNPDPPLPEATSSGETLQCAIVTGPYASSDLPEGMPLCEDIGATCQALPDPAPPVVFCEYEAPALPEAPAGALRGEPAPVAGSVVGAREARGAMTDGRPALEMQVR